MGQVVYKITDIQTHKQFSSSFYVTITRTSGSGIAGLDKIVSASIQINNYESDGCSLSYGDYFNMGPLKYTGFNGAGTSSNHSYPNNNFYCGDKILSISGSQRIQINVSGGTFKARTGCQMIITAQVDSRYNASKIETYDTSFGQDSTVRFDNEGLSKMKHIVTWSLGSHVETKVSVQGADSLTYTIPYEWMDALPAQQKGTLNISVQTYYVSGSKEYLVGDIRSTRANISIPTDIRPSISGVTIVRTSDYSANGYATTRDIYIQNLTGITVYANDVTPGQGTQINDVLFICNSIQDGIDGPNYTYVIDRLNGSGRIMFTVTATDKRGRKSNPVQGYIDVIEYAKPNIASYSALRCTSSGIASEHGVCAAIRIIASVSPISFSGTSNSMHIKAQFYNENNQALLTLVSNDLASGVTYVFGQSVNQSENNSYIAVVIPTAYLDPQATYFVRFTVTDDAGGLVQKDIRIQAASYSIHIKNGGLGVAFGKTCQKEQAVEINPQWDFVYHNVVQPVFVYSTQQPEDPIEGLIWIKPR